MRGRPPTLELLVFVVGTSTLGAEIAAARLMAPFFGDSTIVWANTIAIVLVALSIGYWFGGRMADRHPHLRGLCLLVLVASLLLGLVPIVANPFLSLSVDAFDSVSIGTFAGSLFGVLALVAVPVLMLGAVSPWAIRLKLRAVEDSGEVAGRMYAISTVGSLFGTFLAALLLIPLVGTQRTFLIFALALALVAALGLGLRWLAAPALVGALLALPPGTIKGSDEGRVIYETETEYQYARVVEYRGGERRLELNEGQAIHSTYRAESVLTGGYWDGLLVSPFAGLRAPPRRVAMLGTAAGTTARAYARYLPDAGIDAVEIDGELFDIGRRYFDLRDRPQLRTITADARPFLRRTDARYDVIMVDAYRQPYIPFYLTTREFFALARSRLAPGGIVAINVGHPEGSDRLEQVLSATLGAVFDTVARDPIEPTNTILMASDAPLTPGRLIAASGRLPAD
ncbi:MAG: spermidine synthase, partial [Solirubrobacteraceae bacterium]